MAKIKYEIDPHNRVVLKETGKKTDLVGFRKVLDGRFKINKNNRLTYHIKSPLPADLKIPHQIKLRGNWSLTKKHDLRLTLDKWGRKTFGDQITLKGDVIDVKKNTLLFALTTRGKDGTQSIYGLKLKGSWQADKNNRLTFRIKKERQPDDILILDGAWQINKRHQIIYRYEKVHLIRKHKKIHTLTFKGYWDIKDKTRISYVVDKATNSVFDFKTSIGLFKSNYIKYKLGIGLSNRARPIKRTIVLFGRWKITRRRGLSFELRYGKGKVRDIILGAKVFLSQRDTVIFKLRNSRDEDLGVTLQLQHKILKGESQVFLRLLKSRREATILAGAGWRW